MKREYNMENLNTIICSDNLQALRQMRVELRGKVDLVYLDPPYATEFDQMDSENNLNSVDLLIGMLRPGLF